MKIKDSTLRQIIREEYSRLINEGEDADAPKTIKQKLKDAIDIEADIPGTGMGEGMLKVIQGLHNKGKLTDAQAATEAKKLKMLSAAAKAALRA